VTQVLETIHQELLVAMALCGATDVAALDASVLLER
jgi:isopentenyl diphosphate isomerase/L-lactate dehydrogenase-like FMN-dependent dehydrogenase